MPVIDPAVQRQILVVYQPEDAEIPDSPPFMEVFGPDLALDESKSDHMAHSDAMLGLFVKYFTPDRSGDWIVKVSMPDGSGTMFKHYYVPIPGEEPVAVAAFEAAMTELELSDVETLAGLIAGLDERMLELELALDALEAKIPAQIG